MARLYYLQVVFHQKLSDRAASQIYEEIRIAPRRGDISDRHGRKFAVNVEVDSLYAVPTRISDPEGAAAAVAGATGMRRSQVLKSLRKKRSFVWLRRRLSPEVVREIREKQVEGVGFLKENRRYYPQRELAAQVVGIASIDNQGLEGVELAYDDYLLREEIGLLVERDAHGREIFLSPPPVALLNDEAEVRLTIDEVLQHVAQKELDRGVREAGARGGTIVVLEPDTGEILAMANRPFFNPNEFQRFGPQYFRNRAIGDAVEPGSILKPVLLAAALEEGAVTLRSLFFCENGQMPFMGRVLHDVHPHGYLDSAGVIVNSSNIGATKMAIKLGAEKYHDYLRDFGFGEETEVDLPGESGGLLRPVREWSGLSISALAIGQEISVTALQTASAYAALINGGILYRPTVMREVVDDEGRVVKRTSPRKVREVISPATSRKVRETLMRVVQEGTGGDAAVEGYRVAGKTGTAQKYDPATRTYSNRKYLASFAGCAPAGDPRLVVVVMIDEPETSIWGGSVAAPVFSRVVGQALRYLNVPREEGGNLLVLEKPGKVEGT